MANYFNSLTLREKLAQLSKCRFMESSEFSDSSGPSIIEMKRVFEFIHKKELNIREIIKPI